MRGKKVLGLVIDLRKIVKLKIYICLWLISLITILVDSVGDNKVYFTILWLYGGRYLFWFFVTRVEVWIMDVFYIRIHKVLFLITSKM